MDASLFPPGLTWPYVLLFAWLAGEVAQRVLHLPRLAAYATAGFALGGAQLGVLPWPGNTVLYWLANMAFGLIVFEFGYRVHLRWLWSNRWLGASGVAESFVTFGAVCIAMRACGLSGATAVLLAAIAISTSPAVILRVIDEQKSSGQVSERVLHLAALNGLIAIVVYKLASGAIVWRDSGRIDLALYVGPGILLGSAAMGGVAGVLMPVLMRALRRVTTDGTLAFSLATLCLVAQAHAWGMSPALAALCFGLTARHRRIVLNPAQRGFGPLGELLTLFFFVFAASTLDWHQMRAGLAVGGVLFGTRYAVKIACATLFARRAGLSRRKGVLTGLAQAPLSAFAFLALEQVTVPGAGLGAQVAALAAALVALEILSALPTRLALVWARENNTGD
ncbi:cation:proton antiporter [Paludibacterium yongneupense]|uniref:cation:proton antiporter n=1 Tax=Paludibacterium yongneupense TaxID=400061 RepID=UPI00041BD90A|nr:cation:proton antiporter [Paludibacterium yongneupense]